MKRLLVLLTFLLPNIISFAQAGCTDPQATNFDPDALQNDGSCLYPPTSYQLTQIAELAEALEESSGLAYCDQQLWSQNDTDNPANIFSVDTTDGSILRKVIIEGAVNTDWEELAEDKQYLYIGDFGNNTGNRTDLRIYKVDKSALASADTVSSQLINFAFSDQTEFDENINNHNFDCEAMIIVQDTIHLFSKNWVDRKTRHYWLPNEPGTHIAQLRDSLEADGLVTAATIDADGTVLLLGYNGLDNFMWLLFDYQGSRFFSGNKRRIELGNVGNNGQTEGIAFAGQGAGYISSERLSQFGFTIPQKLLSFETRQWTAPLTNINKELASADFKWDVYPNPVSHNFLLEFSEPLRETYYYELITLLGQQILFGTIPPGSRDHKLLINADVKGWMVIRLQSEEKVLTKIIQVK